jgi:Helix-turn-helix domain of resolvase
MPAIAADFGRSRGGPLSAWLWVWESADLPAAQDTGAAIRAAAKPSSPYHTPVSHHRVRSLGAEAAKSPPQSVLSRRRKTNTLPRFPKGGLWLPKGSAESTITLEAMGVAELLTADPLTRGRAVACQLLTKQRRLLDDVDGAGRRSKPSFTREQFNKVRARLRQQAVGIAQIARETGLTRQTVYRIKGDPAGAEGALVAWGCEYVDLRSAEPPGISTSAAEHRTTDHNPTLATHWRPHGPQRIRYPRHVTRCTRVIEPLGGH